jgi:uncharacterized protein Yka (UPF0111/DUF47 family)
MFLKKEREVVELMDRHLVGIEKWLETASDSLKCYLRDDLPAAQSLALKLTEIQSGVDDLQCSIWNCLCGGAYLPVIRRNLLVIVKSIGKLAECAKNSCDMFILARPDIPEKMKDPFFQLATAVFDSIHPIKDGVIRYLKGGDLAGFIKAGGGDFGRIKASTTAIENELTREICSAQLDSWQKMKLMFCLENLMKVSAQGGETANELQRIFIELIV